MIGLDPQLLVMIGAAVLAASTFVLFIGLVLFGEQRRTARRLDSLSMRWQRPDGSGGVAPQLRRIQNDSAMPIVDKLIKQLLPRPKMLRERLARTGWSISISTYFLCSIAFGIVLTLVAVFAFHFPVAPCVLGGVFATIGVPHFFIGLLIRRRQKAFTALFPEAIDLIVRGLKSGLPVSESIRTVGQEMPSPIGAEFRQVSDEVEFGKTLEEAMVDAISRIDTPEFKFFVVALSVQRETGGNLGETLENLSDVLRKRRQMKQKIKAMASEPKASAWILGCLPFLMFGIIFMTNSQYALQLFTDPRGHVLIGAGLLSQAIGVAVMAKMVRFEI
jgi:tight adherence protein B